MAFARTVYANLARIDQVDLATSAIYRQQAQEVLANPRVGLELRQAISDRLMQANRYLSMQTVNNGDSY
jgi:hypothetical protein